MKIIVSSSKAMIDTLDKDVNWELCPLTERLISYLKDLQNGELEKAFKLEGDLLTKLKDRIKAFSEFGSIEARKLYQGLAYKMMEIDMMNEKEQDYLSNKLLILSAFYGPIGIFARLKPYRLDFNVGLKVDGKNLRAYWKEYYNSSIDYGETVLNLASKEFSSLFKKDNYKWIDFDFFEKRKDGLKTHSTISKKARGLMVKYLYKNKVEEIRDLVNFNYDSYSFSQELSSDRKFVYVKNIND